MARSHSSGFVRSTESVRHAAAIVTLAGAYACAATGFDLRWLIVTLVATLVVATGESHWDTAANPCEPLGWPARRMFVAGLLPGWLIGVGAGACELFAFSPRVVISLWVVGATSLLVGTWLISGRVRSTSAPQRFWPWGVVAIGVGVAVRVWEIDLIPTFVHGDAELNLRFASAFYDNPNRDWLAPTYSLMPLYFALNGLGTFLFGFTVLGARASDVLLGILALVFLFDGLRRVANLWLAVVGTLLTAVNHTHVAFSRVGTGNIQTTCVVAMVFAIFSRVWTAPTYLNAVLLGLAVVIGIQTYQASYAALPLLLAVILVLAVFNPQRRRALVVPTCLFLLTIASIGSPVAVAMVRHRGELVARAHIVSLLYPETFQHVKQDIYHTDSNTAVIAQQAWLALLGFHRGHDYEAQYGASVPMADPYTAALMVPGVVLALCGLRQFAAATTVIFTVGYLLLGLGTSVSPGFNRATGALALGPVLAAIALVRCTDPLTGIGTLGRYLRGLFLGAVVTFILTVNLQIYLPRARSATDIESAAGRLAQKYADHYHVHLVSWPLGLPGNDGLRLIVGRLPIDLHRETDPVAYVEHLNLSGQNLLIIHGAQAAARDAARQRFPGARVEVWPRPEVPTLFLMFVDADGRG